MFRRSFILQNDEAMTYDRKSAWFGRNWSGCGAAAPSWHVRSLSLYVAPLDARRFSFALEVGRFSLSF